MSATLPPRSWSATDRSVRPAPAQAADSGPLTLVVTLVAITALGLAYLRWSDVPLMGFVPVSVLATVFLPARQVETALVYAASWVVGLTAFNPSTPRTPAIVLLVSILFLAVVARSRSHHGAGTFTGDRMLTDLRDRLFKMGDIPALPVGWRAERAFASAHGHAFAGDFNVTVLNQDTGCLEVVLTDVTGKGEKAGTRALVLGGVMSGLLGSAPYEQVLPMANSFLDREQWDEGFATAVHVRIDLTSGETSIASAGHPPAVHFDSRAGQWRSVTGGRGLALGVVGGASYPAATLTLERGDALVICTDGVIEARGRTLDDGVDWMLGTAESSVVSGFDGLADELVREGRSGVNDDRAAVIFWRE